VVIVHHHHTSSSSPVQEVEVVPLCFDETIVRGQPVKRFAVNLPQDLAAGQNFRVQLDSSEFVVSRPHTTGDRIVVVVPSSALEGAIAASSASSGGNKFAASSSPPSSYAAPVPAQPFIQGVATIISSSNDKDVAYRGGGGGGEVPMAYAEAVSFDLPSKDGKSFQASAPPLRSDHFGGGGGVFAATVVAVDKELAGSVAVNEGEVATLMSMGFGREQCIEALKLGGSVEIAANRLLNAT